MVKRIVAIAIIFACTAAAWVVLGITIKVRTENQDNTMREKVGQLWGQAHMQQAPRVYYQTTKQVTYNEYVGDRQVTKVREAVESVPLPVISSDIDVDFDLDYRRKGLLWYSTYKVNFAGKYQIVNNTDQRQKVYCAFSLPTTQAIYDDFSYTLGENKLGTIKPNGGDVKEFVYLDPGKTETLKVAYRSQGQDSWRYYFGSGVSQVKNFNLSMNTNFDKIDFPDGTISPTVKSKSDSGWLLSWKYKNLLTGYSIGMEMPKKLNPGPWVSKITFFAPVSLFLFFFIVFMLTTVRKIKVHPMNYFFMGAGFFSFHLLLAYLVDHISINLAFIICSIVSVFLVISYMRLVVPGKFAYVDVAIAQFVYLVAFSYTFFYEQYTGLIVTILCILTLFVMMQFTGGLDWDELFKRGAVRRDPEDAISSTN